MKHDENCRRLVTKFDVGQFSATVERDSSSHIYGDQALIVLGTVRRGYPRIHAKTYCYENGTSPEKPWSAVPWIPDALRAKGARLCEYDIRGFRTREEALEALERFWLRRLGAI